jgi:hypothetical protein
MFYSLIRGGGIKKEDVANIYEPGLKLYEVLEDICEAIRADKAKHIKDKGVYNINASNNPLFIEISTKGTKYLAGIHHDMISFPDSTDKMLQVLASGNYDGKYDKTVSVYSNWFMWTDSRLGIAPFKEIKKLVDEKDLRVIPLRVFIKKFPKASRDVVNELKQEKIRHFWGDSL